LLDIGKWKYLAQGFLKYASIPPGVLRLDPGRIQHCINTQSLHSFLQSGNTVPTWSRKLVLMNVMQPLHWPFSSLLQWQNISLPVLFRFLHFFVIKLLKTGIQIDANLPC